MVPFEPPRTNTLGIWLRLRLRVFPVQPLPRLQCRRSPDTHTLNFLLIQTRGWAMKELLEMVAKALVDHPDEVAVRSVEGQEGVVAELRVHPGDVRQVIGLHV